MACTSSCAADRWRIVGRRGGLSGFADRLRAYLSAGMAPGLHGERRAVIAGIVLGEDEGLSDELRAKFRASGLYHLLAVSGQNVALIAGGAIMLVYLIGLSRFVGQILALVAIGGTCSRSAGSRPSSGPGSQGRSPRWPGLPQAE